MQGPPGDVGVPGAAGKTGPPVSCLIEREKVTDD